MSLTQMSSSRIGLGIPIPLNTTIDYYSNYFQCPLIMIVVNYYGLSMPKMASQVMGQNKLSGIALANGITIHIIWSARLHMDLFTSLGIINITRLHQKVRLVEPQKKFIV